MNRGRGGQLPPAGDKVVPYPADRLQDSSALSAVLGCCSLDAAADIRDLVIDQMEQGIMVWSREGVCELLNTRYYELLMLSEQDVGIGITREEHLRRSVKRGELSADNLAAVEAGFARREPFSYDRQVGDDRIVSTAVRPLGNGGHVVTFTDVTEARRGAVRLKDAMSRAEDAERRSRGALDDMRRREQNTNQITEFIDWLQCARSIDELYEIARQSCSGLFPGSDGQLFIYSNSRDVLDGVATWGSQQLIRNMQPHDCWSLRRGHIFRFGQGLVQIPCGHVDAPEVGEQSPYLCMPIVAHGDTVGLLHLQFPDADRHCAIDMHIVTFAQRCAELLGIAIANVQLRDELHEQSTRDPLTGLYNRRYFQERCRAELKMAARDGAQIALVAFDIDDFKQYNDRFGHEAGDKVLCALGDIVRAEFPGRQVAARIGGEEFSVLLPVCGVEAADGTVREFVKAVNAAEMRYLDKPLPPISVSAGLALFPHHASELHELARIADQAMYRAKDLGKNRVVVHDQGGETTEAR